MKQLYKIQNILILASVITLVTSLIIITIKYNNGKINKDENKHEYLNREEVASNKVDSTEIKRKDSINNLTIKELKPFFNISKDEFNPNGLTWYKPKNASKYVNENSVYCYFQVIDNKASNFRFRLQYLNDEWLFIKKVQFSIDGQPYEFTPINVESDNDTEIWEWFDENIDAFSEPLIDAISKAKVVKMKLIGRQYYDTKTMTKYQIESINKTYKLYKAMNGQF